jgi:excisionase family DNA binding protein
MTVIRERWITLEEAAEHLSLSKSYLYQNVLGIPRARIGNQYRYRISDLDTWLLSKMEQSSE